jgi:hypothetical protein
MAPPADRALLRILIVEDTAERQAILRSLYRDHAWVLAHTGRRAITLLSAFPFDVVSLDYNLAGELTGADVARALVETAVPAIATDRSSCRVVIHSLNPRGVAAIQAILPEAVVLPVAKIARSNATLKRLRAGLAASGAAFDFSLRRPRLASDDGTV